jgi:hypothetical protein
LRAAYAKVELSEESLYEHIKRVEYQLIVKAMRRLKDEIKKQEKQISLN